MTKDQTKKIFEKYNPADEVIRCPNGRAKMREPLDLYAKAAVNLYGIIRRDEFVKIFNTQNKEQTTSDEVYTILLPNVFKDKWYGFYKDYIVHYLVLENFDLVEYLEREQIGKPRYIPPKEKFIKYEWEEHEDTEHWWNVNKFMGDNFGYSKNTTDNYFEIKGYLQLGIGTSEIGKILEKHDIVFDDLKQAQKLFDKLMLASNNSRMWQNKGYTPEEMMKLQNNTQPKKPVFIKQQKQIWPNEKCPCGSGRKYKKCCGIDECSGSAHLSHL